MKKVTIDYIHLRNFRICKDKIFEFKGKSFDIFGANGTGKTTIFDAVCWLLFGKDSRGQAAFDIKELSENGEPKHKLEHEVEAVFDVNGKKVKLRRILTESWTKKRDTGVSELTGHTTSYCVNDVPDIKQADYKEIISQIATEESFKLLTSSIYFNEQLKWPDRRRILIELCGDITDKEVISSNSSLKTLPDILEGRSIDDHKKIIKSKRDKLEKEKNGIEPSIKENERNIVTIGQDGATSAMFEIERLEREIKTKNIKLLQLQSGGAVAEKQNELRTIQAEMLNIQTNARKLVQDKINSQENTKRVLHGKFIDIESEIITQNNIISQNDRIIKNNTSEMIRLKEDWFRVNDIKFEYTPKGACPSCGALSEYQVNFSEEKALADFNLSKSERLIKINEAGKNLKSQVEVAHQEMERAKAQLTALKTEKAKLETNIEAIDKALLDLQDEMDEYKNNHDYQEKEIREAEINNEITALKNGQQIDIDPIKQKISELESERDIYKEKISLFEKWQESKKRIKELQAKEKSLAADLEKLAEEAYLCEQFTKTQTNLLNDQVNNKFGLARFKLFDSPIKGESSPTCQTTYHGAPYETALSNGERIIIGLDIIKTLSEYYGLSLPLFIDNAESVTSFPEMDCQTIKLIANVKDKKLRIEPASGQVAERHAEQLALV